MGAGTMGPLPGEEASGDQRSLGRQLFRRGGGRGGFSPGVFSDQGDEAAWLRYLMDVGKGLEPSPRAQGFRSVRRR